MDPKDLDEIERLAGEADEREDHPGYTDAPLYAMQDYLTPARVLELVMRARDAERHKAAVGKLARRLKSQKYLLTDKLVDACQVIAALEAELATLKAKTNA